MQMAWDRGRVRSNARMMADEVTRFPFMIRYVDEGGAIMNKFSYGSRGFTLLEAIIAVTIAT